MKACFIILATIISFLYGCSATGSTSTSNEASYFGGRPSHRTAWVDSTLATLSLEQKVGQLVFVWTPGHYYPTDSDQWIELERYAKKKELGGFIFSTGEVYEYAVQLNRLQRLSRVPLLIASDLEYGLGMRIKDATTFPAAMAVGATRNPHFSYEIGKITAEEARAVGIHQNYAPDADVNTNPRNPVINTRSFGDNVSLVTEMTTQFVKGTQDGGVAATLKHFPGHGDSDVDTHVGLMTLAQDSSRLWNRELKPFQDAIGAGAISVMVGHIAVPAFDTVADRPASVSPTITTGLLQQDLKFNGLVVSDAMRMQAVARKYPPGEAAVLAVKAGIDLVLLPVDADLAVDAIVKAVRRGEIPEERIDQSVRKLLHLKQWVGLDRNRMVNLERIGDVVGTREHRLTAQEIARDAVTVLGNDSHILPLPKVDSRKILDIVFSDSEDPETGRSLQQMLSQRHPKMGFASLDPRSNFVEYDSVMSAARRSDILLLQLHYFTRSEQMTGTIGTEQAAFLRSLDSLGKPIIVISLGNPYVVMDIPKPMAYVCTYSDADCMQEAVAEVLFAEAPARGNLPITIPNMYAFGDGVEYPKTTLRFGVPEEAGFDSRQLSGVDTIMQHAIRDSAFPGGVLLVARNGLVIYHKAYGAYDYSMYSKRVSVRTVYDLASVTKVIATTSAVMRLVDEGRLRLDDRVINYMPQFGQNGKEHITLFNLMVHNSGLPAWRKFHEFCEMPQCVLDSVFATGLVYKTGDSTVYSDLGIITMGKVVEKVSGVTLDRYVDSVFFRPLGMNSTMYNPPQFLLDHIAPTEIDTYWKKTGVAVRGRVHDENAAVLGGVSGHAGLFSTASDLAIMMEMLLNGGTYGGNRYLKDETVHEFVRRQFDTDTRAIGWDTKDPVRSWAGSLMSNQTFLHTGFTGTSVAADPERNLIVILLTNRVYPSRSFGKIAKVRPRVHDAVVKAIVR